MKLLILLWCGGEIIVVAWEGIYGGGNETRGTGYETLEDETVVRHGVTKDEVAHAPFRPPARGNRDVGREIGGHDHRLLMTCGVGYNANGDVILRDWSKGEERILSPREDNKENTEGDREVRLHESVETGEYQSGGNRGDNRGNQKSNALPATQTVAGILPGDISRLKDCVERMKQERINAMKGDENMKKKNDDILTDARYLGRYFSAQGHSSVRYKLAF